MQDHYLWELIFQWLLGDRQFCMLQYWFTSCNQVTINSLLYSWFLVSSLIVSFKKFCTWSNFSTKRDYDESLETIENICWMYDSQSIIKFWSIKRRHIYSLICQLTFLMNKFFQLKGRKKTIGKDIGWNELSLSRLDPRVKECELKVQMIIHLQINQSIIRCFYWLNYQMLMIQIELTLIYNRIELW